MVTPAKTQHSTGFPAGSQCSSGLQGSLQDKFLKRELVLCQPRPGQTDAPTLREGMVVWFMHHQQRPDGTQPGCATCENCARTAPQELGAVDHVLAGAEHQPTLRLDRIQTARAALLHLQQLHINHFML